MTITRRDVLIAGAAAPILAAPALAQERQVWRMATSWPKDLPGPGVSAARIAKRIDLLSGGRLKIELFAAGELAPAFGVFDAVSTGGADIGHTASLFWGGKTPAAPIFTSAPLGLTPWEHLSWVEMGGGQAVWDALYAPFGVKPFLAGNTGPSMGGWVRKPINGLDDMKGLRMRIAGLGAQMLQGLGVAPVAVSPGEIFGALQTGAVDAAEFAGAAADRGLGLHKSGALYYGPGFHEPNGAGEAIVNAKLWRDAPADLRALVEAACREEHALGLAESERANAAALAAMREEGVDIRAWPADVMAAAQEPAAEAISNVGRAGALEAAVVQSWRAALERSERMAAASYTPFLNARAA